LTAPPPAASRRRAGAWVTVLVLATGTIALAATPWPPRPLWPPVVALAVIVLTRHALAGLLAGALAGAIVAAGGDPWAAYLALAADHLAPNLQSPWKMGAVAFTLVLGGFAAVLEAGGGFTALLRRLAPPGRDACRRVESAAGVLGLLCFFDGLANSMVVGRVSRDLADASGVARVKLAYIVDSTSSAVACVALISTWIAFQLAMIGEAFALAGRDLNPYVVFVRSLPSNFHCWFTLVLLAVAIGARFHPGPMAGFAAAARPRPVSRQGDAEPTGHPATALVPLAVLLAAFLAGFLVWGDPAPGWPDSRERIVAAFGTDAGPLVLVAAGLAATAAAVLLFPAGSGPRPAAPLRAFGRGVGAMVGPVGILFAAWLLGSVMGTLGTAELIAGLLAGAPLLWLTPTLTFITGAAISFATGTSWGTMGLLFPLAVPAAAGLGGDDALLAVVVAAVFSGAVFGDHCSPFSDTTIVSSISCGVEPHDHVRTQIPYALISATVAVVAGFIPAGLGVPAWVSLAAGTAVLVLLPRLTRPGRRARGPRPETAP
jgi:tetracycline resistance efflux pump